MFIQDASQWGVAADWSAKMGDWNAGAAPGEWVDPAAAQGDWGASVAAAGAKW